MNNLHYAVSGLANADDRTKVKNALGKIAGVQQAAIDMARGTVEVGYNAPADENQIKACIEKTGYSIL